MNTLMIDSKKKFPEGKPLRYQRYAQILSTGAGVPDEVVTNQNLIDEFNLIASDRAVQFSIGVRERRRARLDIFPSRYLEKAALECLDRAGVPPEKLDRIIYAGLFGDHLIPATSLRVLERLGVRRGIPVMDISAACSGVMHAVDLALGYINRGEDYVLVLGGDCSAINKNMPVEKRTQTVFLNGDGFAGILLGHSETRKFHARYFYTNSDMIDLAFIPFGTEVLNRTGNLSPAAFAMTMPDGKAVHQTVLDSCQIITENLFKLSDITIDDIDFVITSDQTHFVWKDQLKQLNVSEQKSISCFHKYGNTVAAMVPLNLNEAISNGLIQRGMRILMMGHGAGASGGGFIFTY
jgi:3-oxoacyl-[acyl-carrier-protein] synthase-3